jgi:formamidopyrimidine-DNA glycosylase
MPELPEVETVARLIRPRLVGRTIRAAHVSWKRTLGGTSSTAFAREVVGARVAGVWRRAKFVVFDLERGGEHSGWIVGHLRMTGRMHVERAGWDAGAHERVRLDLDDGRAFHFIDVRKFGRLRFTRALEELFGELGPEPLGEAFTPAWLASGLRARRRRLKPLLLDQTFVAGLGNIYVDESLHRAGLHPLRASDRVSASEAERLHGSIRATLGEAIEREGSSFDAYYLNPEGRAGEYQNYFRVYDRAGEPCTTCGEAVTRIVVGQRGTHFCARCQPRRAGSSLSSTARRTGRRSPARA